MSSLDIARLRLHAQGIARPWPAATPEQIVTHLGAVQAQDYQGALWSIGLRIADAARTDVEQAIIRRTIVRTWPMRGTLHFVPAVDARWMLELMTPRIVRRTAGRHRQLELDDAAFRRSRAIVGRALRDDPVLTRTAIFAALEKGGVATTGQRGVHILLHLSMERMICHGPHAGKQPTVVMFDDWITASRQLDRDDALRTLAERFFVSHGPATLRDFVWWTGLTMKDAKSGLHLAGPALDHVVVDDIDLWLARDHPVSLDAEPVASLLPGYDELMLGYTDRSAVLPPRRADRIAPGGNGLFLSTLVLDGRVQGTWRREVRAKSVVVEMAPFTRLTAARTRAFAAAAERYGRYLGTDVTLVWTPRPATRSA